MKYKVLMPLVVIALMIIPLSCAQPQEPPQDWVVANETEFLTKCEHCDITFEKYESGGYVSSHLYRKIDGAIVELDQIVHIQQGDR